MSAAIPALATVQERKEATARAIAWCFDQLGSRDYTGHSLRFVSDALWQGRSVHLPAISAWEMARRCAMTMREGIPAAGAVVFYAWEGAEHGYCALSRGCGDVLHAWNVVREDHYLILPHLMPAGGEPMLRYLGWVGLEDVLRTAAAVTEG